MSKRHLVGAALLVALLALGSCEKPAPVITHDELDGKITDLEDKVSELENKVDEADTKAEEAQAKAEEVDGELETLKSNMGQP